LFSGSASRVYFSPDGRNIGGGGSTVYAYNGTQAVVQMESCRTGVLTLFSGHSLYFSPEGKHLGGGGNTDVEARGVSSFTLGPNDAIIPHFLFAPSRVMADVETALVADARHALHGHGRGDYETPLGPPGQSGPGNYLAIGYLEPYYLHGSVRLAGLGDFEVNGSLAPEYGFIIFPGRLAGELTFSNGRGSLTLQLRNPDRPDSSDLPAAVTYRVVAATGAYRGLDAGGLLHLALGQGHNEGVRDRLRGTFTLSL
jgi:hypothetical protein